MNFFSEKQIHEARKKFQEYDTDNDGYITLDELVSVLKKEFDGNLEQAKVSALTIIELIDTNNDGKISWKEFINYSENPKKGKSAEEAFKVYFNLIDTNEDGKIDEKELLFGYKEFFNEDKSEEEVKKIIEKADKNKDGKIDLNEFLDYYKNN